MNLYLRLLWLLWHMRGMARRGVFDESRLSFRVLPNDLDLNLHMNNGRYLTFMDLGRVHLMVQGGLMAHVRRKRWMSVLAAAEIKFIGRLDGCRLHVMLATCRMGSKSGGSAHA